MAKFDIIGPMDEGVKFVIHKADCPDAGALILEPGSRVVEAASVDELVTRECVALNLFGHRVTYSAVEDLPKSCSKLYRAWSVFLALIEPDHWHASDFKVHDCCRK
jgi:hypothetical protein